MCMEVMEFIWQNVSVWNEVELSSPKSILHLHIIEAKSILSGDLVALREVIDSLKFVQSFVEVALA